MACRCDPYEAVPWEEFFQFVMRDAMGVPENMAEHAIRAATIELMNRAKLLKRDVYIDVQEGVADYEIELEDDYVIVGVETVMLQKRELKHAVRSGQQNTFVYRQPCSLLVDPLPNCDQQEGLEVTVVVQPSYRSCSIDRWVFDQYGEAIGMGALARLMISKGAFYDPRQGGIMQKRWQAFMANVKTERAKGGSTGPVFLKVPRFI